MLNPIATVRNLIWKPVIQEPVIEPVIEKYILRSWSTKLKGYSYDKTGTPFDFQPIAFGEVIAEITLVDGKISHMRRRYILGLNPIADLKIGEEFNPIAAGYQPDYAFAIAARSAAYAA